MQQNYPQIKAFLTKKDACEGVKITKPWLL
jgi:hypothetical protein